MRFIVEVTLLTLLIVSIFADNPLDFFKKFHQHDYKLKYERGELFGYDESVVKHSKVVTFKYNRSMAVTNMTTEFRRDILKNDFDVIVQAYLFLSNEYRESAIRFRFNFCDGYQHNIFGAKKAMACGNFRGCPLYKNTIVHTCNFYPDETYLPPYIPSGSYMLQYQFISERFSKDPYLVWRFYAIIYRPIKY